MFNVNDVLKLIRPMTIREGGEPKVAQEELKVVAAPKDSPYLLVEDDQGNRFKIGKVGFGIDFMVERAYEPDSTEDDMTVIL